MNAVNLCAFFSDPFTSQHFKSPPSLTDQNTPKKPISQINFYPGDANPSSRSLHKPNIGHVPDCSQWIDLKPATEDSGVTGPHSQSTCYLTESRGSASEPTQFTSVPQVLY